jgi:hypothetical protein
MLLVDDHTLKKGIERCFFRATRIRTSQLVLMMLSIWSTRLISYLTKKEEYDMTKKIMDYQTPQPRKTSACEGVVRKFNKFHYKKPCDP